MHEEAPRGGSPGARCAHGQPGLSPLQASLSPKRPQSPWETVKLQNAQHFPPGTFGGVLRTCISSKFSGDGAAAGQGPALGEPRLPQGDSEPAVLLILQVKTGKPRGKDIF